MPTDRSESVLPSSEWDHFYEWHVVTAETPAHTDEHGWESVVKLCAHEKTPDGRVFIREVAWFTPTDYAMELAMHIATNLENRRSVCPRCGRDSEKCARVSDPIGGPCR